MNFPQELAALRQWICWRLEPDPKGEKPRKVPYDPKTGRKASSIDCQASATASKKTSKGVRQPSRLRGLWLIRSKTRSNSACDTSRKLQPRG